MTHRGRTKGSTPLAMRPEGLAGRAFGLLMELVNASAYRLVQAMLDPAPDAQILEIGFGTGRLVELLVERLPDGRMLGIDPTETMLKVAQARQGVRRAGARVDLRLGEAGRLPWASASLDAVAALHCFQFWPDPAAGLNEVFRVLRPGGKLALILRRHGVRAPAWLPNPLSRSGDEIGQTRACLVEVGFELDGDAHWPAGALLARRPSTGR